jgi:hypothetical protein
LGDLPAFIKALDDITYPAQRWNAWAPQLSGLIDRRQGDAAAALYKEKVWPDMIGDPLQQAQAGSATINQQAAKKHKDMFSRLFGDQGAELRTMTSAAVRRAHYEVNGRRGVVWCGVVWCGVVWCGVVWCGVVWCGNGVTAWTQKAHWGTA